MWSPYYGRNSFKLLNKFIDIPGCILIIEISEGVLLLINLYNAKTESEQVSAPSDLGNMLEKVYDKNIKSIKFAGILICYLKSN